MSVLTRDRLIALAIVLIGVFGVYLLDSGAPMRVHVARVLMWGPPLLLLPLVAWRRWPSQVQKFVTLATLLVVFGSIAAYATILVLPTDFTMTYWVAHIVFLTISFILVLALSHLCERFLVRKLLSGSA